MTCNCGSGDTPEYYITLDGVGVDGYSPEVNVINETSSSFKIEAVNKSNTQETPAIPKLSYITDTYVSNTSLASTLSAYSTTTQINTALDNKLNKDGSNAPSAFIINDVTLANGNVYAGAVFAGTYHFGTTLGSSTFQITTPSFTANCDRTSGTLINTGTNYRINTQSGTKFYYGSSNNASNEVAIKGDIPTVGNGTITFTQGGVTKGTFTTNQSGNATIALDSGVTNPLVVKGNPTGQSNAYNFITLQAGTTSSDPAVMRVGVRSDGGYFSTPIYMISQLDNPLTATQLDLGDYKLSLNIDSDTLDLTNDNKLTVKEMTGCDSVTGGASGLVPAPSAGDEDKFLQGDGTWGTIDVSNFVTNSSLATTLTDYVTNSALTTTLASYALSSDIPTDNNQLTNGAGYITSSALNGYATESFVTSQGYITGITSSDVTTALGYTPYNSSNPSGYQANVIETVKVNGTALTPSDKAVNITVPTNNNQLTNGAGYATETYVDTGLATKQDELTKGDGIDIRLVDTGIIALDNNPPYNSGYTTLITGFTTKLLDLGNIVTTFEMPITNFNSVRLGSYGNGDSGYLIADAYDNGFSIKYSNNYTIVDRTILTSTSVFIKVEWEYDSNNNRYDVCNVSYSADGITYTASGYDFTQTSGNFPGDYLQIKYDIISGSSTINYFTASATNSSEELTISCDNTIARVANIPTNADYVDLTSNQTVGGNKSFTGTSYIRNTYICNASGTYFGRMRAVDNKFTFEGIGTNRSINFIPDGTGELQYNGNEVATVNEIPDVSQLQEKLTEGNGINIQYNYTPPIVEGLPITLDSNNSIVKVLNYDEAKDDITLTFVVTTSTFTGKFVIGYSNSSTETSLGNGIRMGRYNDGSTTQDVSIAPLSYGSGGTALATISASSFNDAGSIYLKLVIHNDSTVDVSYSLDGGETYSTSAAVGGYAGSFYEKYVYMGRLEGQSTVTNIMSNETEAVNLISVDTTTIATKSYVNGIVGNIETLLSQI